MRCGLEARRDAEGVLNIARLCRGGFNRVVDSQLLLRWSWMKEEPKRARSWRTNNHPQERRSLPIAGGEYSFL